LLDTLDAVDRYFTQASESRELKEHGAEQLRTNLLDQARQFYERFLRQYGDRPELRTQLAMAHHRLGMIAGEVGAYEEAVNHEGRAIAGFWELLAEKDDPALRALLSQSYTGMGGDCLETGRWDEAENSLQQATDILTGLIREHPDNLHYWHLQGRTLGTLRLLYLRTRRDQKAEAAARKALAIYGRLHRHDPDDVIVAEEKALTHNNLGVLYRETARPDRALAEHEQALEIRAWLAEKLPDSPSIQLALAQSHFNLGNLHWALPNRREQAEPSYRKARAILEVLVHKHPTVRPYKNQLAKTIGSLGFLFQRRQRLREAHDCFCLILPEQQKLVRDRPDVVDFRANLAVTYAALGDCATGPRAAEEKLDWYARAVEQLREALGRVKDHPKIKSDLVQLLSGRADLLHDLGRHQEALKDIDEALALAGEDRRNALREKRRKIEKKGATK
jgi:tetratricopeptide (TPR) repeat protein